MFLRYFLKHKNFGKEYVSLITLEGNKPYKVEFNNQSTRLLVNFQILIKNQIQTRMLNVLEMSTKTLKVTTQMLKNYQRDPERPRSST